MPKSLPPMKVFDNQRILLLRGKRVILDADLAELYDVETKRLNQQVRRNPKRFPEDFAFVLTSEEWDSLRLQNATSKNGRGGRQHPPYVFTEHGALMAAGVLNSRRAIEVSIYVVRVFVAMRELASNTKELAKRLDELEAHIERRLAHQDKAIADILSAIRALMAVPPPKSGPIGFVR